MKSLLFFKLGVLGFILSVSFNNCTEKPLEKMEQGSMNTPTPTVNGVSKVSIDQDLVTVEGSKLDSVTAIGIKGGDKTVNLAIQSKGPNLLIAKANSVLELANGIYNLIMSRANAESIAPIQVTISNSPKFSSIAKAYLGTMPTVGGTTKVFSLPAAIPTLAKEVLVYAFVGSGAVVNSGTGHYEIYTQEGAIKYINMLFVHTYYQNALSFNSDNIWLPVTNNRQITVSLTDTSINFSADGNNLYGHVYVTGYR